LWKNLKRFTTTRIDWCGLQDNQLYSPKNYRIPITAVYYRNQLIRSSGSPVLNYGEAQATVTDKDFIHKMSISVKELKESRGCLKVLAYLNLGEQKMRELLLSECEELIAIGFSMIKKRKAKSTSTSTSTATSKSK